MKKLISIILILSIVLTACSLNPSRTKEEQPEEIKYAEEQVYKTVYSEEIQNLNYLTAQTDDEFALAANLVDSLVDYDMYGMLQPDLAEAWEVSSDGLTWTFHLRHGVKWVDFEGKEVADTTAQDFVSAAKYLLAPQNQLADANMFYGEIKNAEEYYNGKVTDFAQVGVKAADEYTLQYILKEPVPYFESMLTYACFLPVYGPFLEEKAQSFGTSNSALLYNGAYVLSKFEPQIQRVLTKNTSYWDRENVYITESDYKYNAEAESSAQELFKKGETSDVSIQAAKIDEWMNNSELKNQVRPGMLGYYTYFYAFNFNPQFSAEYEPDNWKIAVNNSNFRKSIMSGFDRVSSMKNEDPYNPEYRIINTITPPNFAAQNGSDFTKTANLAQFESKEFFNEKEALSYKEKAVEELKSTGAKFPVKILMPFNTGSSSWAGEAQQIKQQLEKLLGTDYIEVILMPHDPEGFIDGTRKAGNYALMKCSWIPDYADPQTYSDPFERGGNYNFPEFSTGLNSEGKNIYEAYETAVRQAKAEAINLAKRYELFANAEAMLIDNSFVIPYNVSCGDYVASKIQPFEAPYSQFGICSYRWKGQKLLALPMSTEQFYLYKDKWQAARDAALKEATSK